MRRRTKKRAKEERTYLINRQNFIDAQREKDNQGRIYCIFCGRVIIGEPSLHHGDGRDNEKLLDEDFWFLSHNKCHVHQYHTMSCADIEWWPKYIQNIQGRHPTIYQKELIRMFKAGIL